MALQYHYHTYHNFQYSAYNMHMFDKSHFAPLNRIITNRARLHFPSHRKLYITMLFNSRTWFNPAQRHTPFLFDVLRRCSTGKSYNVCRQQHNDQNIIYTNYTEFSMCSCANINKFLLRKTVAFFTKPNSVALWPFDLLPYQQKNHNTIITFLEYICGLFAVHLDDGHITNDSNAVLRLVDCFFFFFN